MIKSDNDELHGDLPSAADVDALPDRKELAAITFERTRMPMVITDARRPDYPIVLANHAFLQLTGYRAEEVLGRNCRFLQGQGTSPAALAEIRSGIRAERDVSVELLNYRKDGSAFWNQLHLTPVHDGAGKLLYHFGSQIDQTKFRNVQALEASEHRLLMEVDHRAKNVLAIVDSVVRLSRTDDPDHYAASVQQRVQSLAATHGLLSAKKWEGVQLDELLTNQLHWISPERLTLEGPELIVHPLAVQPLGLAVHEVAINAVQHGALMSPQGQIRINWIKAAQDDGFTLRLEEVGGPPVTEPRGKGFGLVMSEGIVKFQLFGKLEREWLPTGLVTTIHVPDSGVFLG